MWCIFNYIKILIKNTICARGNMGNIQGNIFLCNVLNVWGGGVAKIEQVGIIREGGSNFGHWW